MAKRIEVTVNGHRYVLACDDGQEGHIEQLAAEVSMRAEELARGMPKAGEALVLVMTCLMLADELYESRQEAGALHEHLAMMKAAGFNPPKDEKEKEAAEKFFADAIHDLAARIELMADKLEEDARE